MIANKYDIISKIGEGQFGTVYKGKYKRNNEFVAIKVEHLDAPIPLLNHETRILNYINSKHSTCVPFVYWYGLYDHLPTLIMPLYEYSLEDLYSNKKLSKNDLLHHCIKIINILGFIHEYGVIHCDLKPENFMVKENEIYLIDFGLATIFVDENSAILPQKPDSIFITGTPKFISINIHNGISPSRRDDLISAIYIFSYLQHNCYLPWLNVQDKYDGYNPNNINHFKNQERKRKKIEYYNNLHSSTFEKKILTYLKSIEFQEKPHYQRIIMIFEEKISTNNIC